MQFDHSVWLGAMTRCGWVELRRSGNSDIRSGALGGTRTHDPLLRRQMLYPTELRAHCCREGSDGGNPFASLRGSFRRAFTMPACESKASRRSVALIENPLISMNQISEWTSVDEAHPPLGTHQFCIAAQPTAPSDIWRQTEIGIPTVGVRRIRLFAGSLFE